MSAEVRAKINDALTQAKGIIFGQDNLLDAIMASLICEGHLLIEGMPGLGKTLSVSTKDLPVNFVRLDILDESINEINEAVDKAYNREKLEGLQYTNGNLYREV